MDGGSPAPTLSPAFGTVGPFDLCGCGRFEVVSRGSFVPFRHD